MHASPREGGTNTVRPRTGRTLPKSLDFTPAQWRVTDFTGRRTASALFTQPRDDLACTTLTRTGHSCLASKRLIRIFQALWAATARPLKRDRDVRTGVTSDLCHA
jgi:hypothetical protein